MRQLFVCPRSGSSGYRMAESFFASSNQLGSSPAPGTKRTPQGGPFGEVAGAPANASAFCLSLVVVHLVAEWRSHSLRFLTSWVRVRSRGTRHGVK